MIIVILVVLAALLCIASGIWVAIALVNAVRGNGGLSAEASRAEDKKGTKAGQST
ncbi:MAG: hypothetical protein JSU70_19060 [Phycisphaerales bacterium]|nr:MAG: hypothetical protein JSU70_19060 [Phycisphaerales bacterium]